MQKHSKWPKTEGISTRNLPKFHRLGAFYMAFSGYFLLEWSDRRTWFVKCIYRINKSLLGVLQNKNNSYTPAQAIRLNRMGAMMRTILSLYWRNDTGLRGAYGVHVSPCCTFNPNRQSAISRLWRPERGQLLVGGETIFLFVGNLNTTFAVSNLLARQQQFVIQITFKHTLLAKRMKTW